ncbi:MAG: CHAD domain-containing protein [Flavisolibacter sp.]
MSAVSIHVQMQKHLSEITTGIRQLRHRQDADTIHDFRLSVKTVRARLQLLESYHVHTPKLPRAIQNIYHISGTCRDLQLLRIIVTNTCHKLALPLPTFFLDDLRALTEESLRNLHASCLNLHPAKELEETFANLKTKLPDFAVRHWYETYWQKMLTLAPSISDDAQLHQARRFWKQVLYNWKSLQQSGINLPAKKQEVGSLTATLGDYHDIITALPLLHAATHQQPPHPDAGTLGKIIQHLQQKQAQLKAANLPEIITLN